MWGFKTKYKLLNELLDKIILLSFPPEEDDKFVNPENPRYELYKDRGEERWHDKGYNNAIEDVIRILRKM